MGDNVNFVQSGGYDHYDAVERSIVSEYSVSAEAEYKLSELDAVLVRCMSGAADDSAYIEAVEDALTDGMEMDGRIVSWQTDVVDRRTMVCEVEILPLGNQQRFLRKVFRFEAMASDFF